MAKRILHIDLETFSSVDIKKSGVYAYTEALDFEILLIGYAFGDDPVSVVDLASGDKMPEEFLKGLNDPETEKHAHNALFERRSLIQYGYEIPIEQWSCSMVKAAACGLALGLKTVSEILELGIEGKLSTGTVLIKFWCCPCRPTKVNGLRDRNRPEDDPEKWQEFKEYLINDVTAERAATKILSKFEVSQFERDLYVLDQIINDRGVLCDLDMAEKILVINSEHSAILKNEMRELTGLENSNSEKQLKGWLSEMVGKPITSLEKENVITLIDGLTEEIHEMGSDGDAERSSADIEKFSLVIDVLVLRQKSAKTSIAKYSKMLSSHSFDNRIRGLFQFLGANRTGRWAGRLVQLQNLPRNYIKHLEEARSVFASGDYDLASLLYDDISSHISQLVRTALIAPENEEFLVADFSAIEARVIAWLADETWRINVFNTHGKIYEASASKMFGVPFEEVTKGSPYREKGKVAELALGYQGAKGALTNMGGEKMGLKPDEMQDIVDKWREASPNIVKLWRSMESAAIGAIKSGKTYTLKDYKNIKFEFDGLYLKITLPSGRTLMYYQAKITKNKWGRDSVKYQGIDQNTKRWGWVYSYGGKFTENIVQAIARDLLAVSMLKLHRLGFKIVMHVHDEVVIEIHKDLDGGSEDTLERVCEIMGENVSWAEGLNLTAAGYLTPFYKKD
jgi:DNA polymerase